MIKTDKNIIDAILSEIGLETLFPHKAKPSPNRKPTLKKSQNYTTVSKLNKRH